MSASQASREATTRTELGDVVRRFAKSLPEVLKPSEGQPQVSNEHRALLREIPAPDLATAVVRAVIGVLWRLGEDAEESWHGGATDETRIVLIQDVGRTVGLRVLREYLRVRRPDLQGVRRDVALEEMRDSLTLRHVTGIGFHLTHALHVAVPGLLKF